VDTTVPASGTTGAATWSYHHADGLKKGVC
jgi:hypothetical protein